MLIVSCREQFTDPDRQLATGHIVREVDLANDSSGVDINIAAKLKGWKQKRVLLLVHGYNNEQAEVYDAYEILRRGLPQGKDGYDDIIGYSWPGGDQVLEWWAAKRRANAVARRLRALLKDFHAAGVTLDVMSHSLGARVVLKALKDIGQAKAVRNYFCLAAAVDDESLEEGEEFNRALAAAEHLFVLHSRRDDVLKVVYRVAEFDRALGLSGPEDHGWIKRHADHVHVANCKRCVGKHGDYKRASSVYEYVRRALLGTTQQFERLS